MYRNKRFRLISKKAGTLFWDSRATDKGVALYIRIPWMTLYDKLPREGGKYQFEAIHWTNGGRSWGGSKSVHNRSSFGDLIFSNMTKKNLTAIKRRIIKKAYDHYKKQKAGNFNGVIDFWEDPELGDPEFYNACLRAMVSELDGYGKMIKPGMSDEEVELVFGKAVPKWMEIEYVVADLRRKYLSDKFFAVKNK
jgi:hypothetical protein